MPIMAGGISGRRKGRPTRNESLAWLPSRTRRRWRWRLRPQL